jgi:excisionase family DNA binding protein
VPRKTLREMYGEQALAHGEVRPMPLATDPSPVIAKSNPGSSQPAITKPSLAKRLLRVREAAEYLSLSRWKLRRLVQDGLLPIVQDSEGGSWRVDVRDLDSFIERNKRSEPL